MRKNGDNKKKCLVKNNINKTKRFKKVKLMNYRSKDKIIRIYLIQHWKM
jgi:hypothetical protein